MSNLTPLQSEDGVSYVDLAEVCAVSSMVQRGTKLPARMVSFRCGLYLYVLDSPANLRALGLESEAVRLEKALIAAQRPRAKRTRRAVKPTEAK